MQIEHFHQFMKFDFDLSKSQKIDVSKISPTHMIDTPELRQASIDITQRGFDFLMRDIESAEKRYDDLDNKVFDYMETSLKFMPSFSDNKIVDEQDLEYYKKHSEDRKRDLSFLIDFARKARDPGYKQDYLEERDAFTTLSAYFPEKTPDELKQMHADGVDFREIFDAKTFVANNNGPIPAQLNNVRKDIDMLMSPYEIRLA